MSERNAGCPRVDTPATPTKSLIAQQLSTDWSADSEKKLSDSQALDLITRELSGEEWDADTVDVIAAYVRGTGRDIASPDEVLIDDQALVVNIEAHKVVLP